MTTVTINTDFIEISGHAPERVVCHGISATSQMVANYLEKYAMAEVIKSNGYLKISGISDKHFYTLIVAFLEALHDIDNEYPGNIIFKKA